ncbi:MAG: capsular biosynthesis protein CpsI [Ignavibacteriae bacterium]|nr:MAG: capsular biosynthesis protein CpsI [Ignavibacteriota bacterium]
MNKNILITGAAGFIGFHLIKKICKENFNVYGLDNLNDYYDVSLKQDRLKILEQNDNFEFLKIDLADYQTLNNYFQKIQPDVVINLAAQAGVRYSIENPHAYGKSNLEGFLNILECCRNFEVEHLIYASSSSVYGANKKIPFSESDSVDHPVSLYAATKKSNELLAHSYSDLYKIPTTGLRFFTVYGPFGRPDMAYYSFTKKIFNDEAIDVYNFGKMERDFTFIDDIVESIIRLIPKIPTDNNNWNFMNPNPQNSFAPYVIYNIGNNKPVQLEYFIEVLENNIGKKAIKNYLPMQKGDVLKTYANINNLVKLIEYEPKTSIEEGLKIFVNWYKKYYLM